MKDTTGDRLKAYEELSGVFDKLPKFLPIVARLDGKAFHTFTKGLKRPYDVRLHDCFCETTQAMVREFDPIFGYTQSDEITLVFPEITDHSSIVFDGRKSKLDSVLASFATLKFNKHKEMLIPEKKDVDALFDCRVFAVPFSDVKRVIEWRQEDCQKNSVAMLAQHYFSHKELHGLSCEEMKKKLISIGVSYETQPEWFRNGTSFVSKIEKKKFTCDEIDKLPPLHDARKNPDLEVERRVVSSYCCPIDDPFLG